MSLIIPAENKHVSSHMDERLRNGASIVDLLTDFRTPCNVFGKNDFGVERMIATNIGGSLDQGAFSSYVFEDVAYTCRNRFWIPYASGTKHVIHSPHESIPTNPGKQLLQAYFSEIYYDGTYEDILTEFGESGFQISYCDNSNKFDADMMRLTFDVERKSERNTPSLELQADEFYESQWK